MIFSAIIPVRDASRPFRGYLEQVSEEFGLGIKLQGGQLGWSTGPSGSSGLVEVPATASRRPSQRT